MTRPISRPRAYVHKEAHLLNDQGKLTKSQVFTAHATSVIYSFFITSLFWLRLSRCIVYVFLQCAECVGAKGGGGERQLYATCLVLALKCSIFDYEIAFKTRCRSVYAELINTLITSLNRANRQTDGRAG